MNRIPKKIWQIGKEPFEELSPLVKEWVSSWKELNPEYEYNYLDDDQLINWVSENFGMEWVLIFENYPIGVMKADVARMMLMYKEGGIYADLDTTCLVPIRDWYPAEDYSVYISPEGKTHFKQWLLISEPGHAMMQFVINQIKEASLDNSNYNDFHFVHAITGPGRYTIALLKFIRKDYEDNYNLMDFQPELKKLFELMGVFYHDGEEGKYKFNGVDVKHYFNSVNDRAYESWADKRSEMYGGDQDYIAPYE